jgi:hypothetical protein
MSRADAWWWPPERRKTECTEYMSIPGAAKHTRSIIFEMFLVLLSAKI